MLLLEILQTTRLIKSLPSKSAYSPIAEHNYTVLQHRNKYTPGPLLLQQHAFLPPEQNGRAQPQAFSLQLMLTLLLNRACSVVCVYLEDKNKICVYMRVICVNDV